MKELRSIVNALFCFLVFLMVYAFTVPGHAHGKGAPRFLRMEIRDAGQGTVHPDKISFSVPFGIVRHGLKATGARVRQALESRFDQSMDGTEVTRTFDEEHWAFVKQGPSIKLTVGRPGSESDDNDTATITIPAAFLSRLASHDKPLDVDALLDELTASQTGNLLEVESRDGKVKVWID